MIHIAQADFWKLNVHVQITDLSALRQKWRSSRQSNVWEKEHMMMSSNGNIIRVAGPLCGEFSGHNVTQKMFPLDDIIMMSTNISPRSIMEYWHVNVSEITCRLWKRESTGELWFYQTGHVRPFHIFPFGRSNRMLHKQMFCRRHQCDTCIHYTQCFRNGGLVCDINVI